MRRKLTYEYCSMVCSSCKSRSELSKNNQPVYKKVMSMGWIELLPEKITKEHTKENCRAESLKCSTRSEFARLNQGMYKTSRINGWIEEFFPGSGISKPESWTLISAVRVAKRYRTSGELMKSNRSAYRYLSGLGVTARLFGNKPRCFWTKGTIRAHALLCEFRSDFYRKFRSAYSAMIRIDCKDYAMKGISRGKAESNLFYMWEVVSPCCSGVWKVGVTSSRLGKMQRAKDSARSMGVSIGRYMEMDLGEKSAIDLERKVLASGERFSGISGDGSTELVVKRHSEVLDIFNEIDSGKFKLVN